MFQSRSNGFTFFECLLVILLISILTFAAIPVFTKIKQSFQARIILKKLYSVLQNTKTQAILYNQKILFCGSTDEMLCISNWNFNWVIKKHDGKILNFFKLQPHLGVIRYRFFPRKQNNLIFTSNGWLAAQNGSFWYCQPNQHIPSWAIVINRLARLKILQGSKLIYSKYNFVC